MKTTVVTEHEVRSVPTVEGTSTWNPVPHAHVLDAINGAVMTAGLEIRSKRFELSTSGGNMFASYQLDQERAGMTWQLGFRNSVEKRFAVGVTAGTYTLVCSNMVFTGDFVEFRKHTKGLDLDELNTMTDRAIVSTVGKLQELETWQLQLKGIPISQKHLRILTFEAMRKDAFPPSRFHRFLDAFKDEASRNGQSLYTFHGAVTQTIRDQSLVQITRRSKALNRLVEHYRALSSS